MVNSEAASRLCKDLEEIQTNFPPSNAIILVRPSNQSMLEWHFVLHNLPGNCPYSGGIYHGKLKFTDQYPMTPPTLTMITPTGRLETNTCLDFGLSDCWKPSRTPECILVGLVSFIIDPAEAWAVGVIEASNMQRRELAMASLDFNCRNAEFRELFPELMQHDDESGNSKSRRTSWGTCSLSTDLPLSRRSSKTCDGSDFASDDMTLVSVTTGEGNDMCISWVAEVDVVSGNAEARTDIPNSIPDDLDEEPSGGPRICSRAVARSEEDLESGVSGESVEECWICREITAEPLIRPCACRGSMTGVHASCVETWISTHRARELGDEVPKCSVCNQPYCGSDKRPGFVRYASHLFASLLRQGLRGSVFVVALACYLYASAVERPVWLKASCLFGSGAGFSYKVLSLCVSLPHGRPQPAYCLRPFFTDDLGQICCLLIEVLVTIPIVFAWVLVNGLSFYYIIPPCVAGIVPGIMMLFHYGNDLFTRRTLGLACSIVLLPIRLLHEGAQLIFTNPRCICDPLDGLLHAIVPVASIPLIAFCPDEMPAVLLLSIHGGVLLPCIFEKLILKQLPWKQGRLWWFYMQMSFASTYIANLVNGTLHYVAEGRNPEFYMSLYLFLIVSTIWLGLSLGLGLLINWSICMEEFRNWQRNNGEFTLSKSSSDKAGTAQGGATA